MLKIQRRKLQKFRLPDLLQESINPSAVVRCNDAGWPCNSARDCSVPGIICIFFVEASKQDGLLSSLSS